MAWIASCQNGNGGVFHPDAEQCLWASRKKYHQRENAERVAFAHERRCPLSSYNKGAKVFEHKYGLREMKWGDK